MPFYLANFIITVLGLKSIPVYSVIINLLIYKRRYKCWWRSFMTILMVFDGVLFGEDRATIPINRVISQTQCFCGINYSKRCENVFDIFHFPNFILSHPFSSTFGRHFNTIRLRIRRISIFILLHDSRLMLSAQLHRIRLIVLWVNRSICSISTYQFLSREKGELEFYLLDKYLRWAWIKRWWSIIRDETWNWKYEENYSSLYIQKL